LSAPALPRRQRAASERTMRCRPSPAGQSTELAVL
jgi:hypothetical protein